MRKEFIISKQLDDYSSSSFEFQYPLSLDRSLVFMNGILLSETDYIVNGNILTIKDCPASRVTVVFSLL